MKKDIICLYLDRGRRTMAGMLEMDKLSGKEKNLGRSVPICGCC